jgi:hypothetical protein
VFTEQLCRYIVWKAKVQQQTGELRRMVNAAMEPEPDALYTAVRVWLTVFADPEADRLAVNRILERIENLSVDAGAGTPAPGRLLSSGRPP